MSTDVDCPAVSRALELLTNELRRLNDHLDQGCSSHYVESADQEPSGAEPRARDRRGPLTRGLSRTRTWYKDCESAKCDAYIDPVEIGITLIVVVAVLFVIYLPTVWKE